MYVRERFVIDEATRELILGMSPQFGFDGLGECLFFRTYSRDICSRCRQGIKYDGEREFCKIHGFDFDHDQETWNDLVIRSMSGIFSIRKDWYLRNHIPWDEEFWQHYCRAAAISMFKMEWFPPGRGLWAMGTDFIYERGSMALNNCGLTTIGDDIGQDMHWLMDALMCGVGVGFIPYRNDDLRIYNPVGRKDFVIADSREGWCDSVRALITSFLVQGSPKPRMIYDKVRPAGLPIRGFGGTSSGPGPLRRLHEEIERFFDMFATKEWYDSIMLKADIANCVGCCVVAGNVRRSAELLAGDMDDIIDLKNYSRYPHREAHGWMSNNSVFLRESEDFERLDEIAQRIINNGEPGFINLKNLPFGRIGKSMDGLRYDEAIGFNPCGEQPLEDKELCTLVETCPTICNDDQKWYRACDFATMYASTVTLLPTHRPETNAVMLKNRRIGVGIVDVCKWQLDVGTTNLIKYLRAGYARVRSVNKWLNTAAGVPLALRNTTIKPGGTSPKLPGRRSGWQWPTFGTMIRRLRVARNHPSHAILVAAGIPHEPDVFSEGTDVFEWPLDQGDGGRIRPATDVSIWEQANMLTLLQREWSDNAVSCTLYFRPMWNLVKDIDIGETYFPEDLEEIASLNVGIKTEEDWEDFLQVQERCVPNQYKIELVRDRFTDKWHFKLYDYDPHHEEDHVRHVLASIAPLTKSAAVLPHATVGVYRQMPEEGITRAEYERRLAAIRPPDWSRLRHSDGADEKYCEGPSCEIKYRE